jgi:hypothetical protein
MAQKNSERNAKTESEMLILIPWLLVCAGIDTRDIKEIRKDCLYWKLVTKCSGLDSQSAGVGVVGGKASIISRRIIFSEFIPIFYKKKAEYCLQSEERKAIRKSPQQMLIFCKLGAHHSHTAPCRDSAGTLFTPLHK